MNEERQELLSEGLMTVADTCRFLAVSRATAYRMMETGELPYVRLGHCRRIPKRALIEYTRERLVTRLRPEE